MRPSPSRPLLLLLLVAVAAGWGWREWAFAAAMDGVASATVARDDVSMTDFLSGGERTGRVGTYFKGATPGLASLNVGRFVLEPGKQPHPDHRHPEEELLIVLTGQGSITCAGRTVDAAPGAVMYAAPDIDHGLTNTGQEPLEFLYIKWIAR